MVRIKLELPFSLSSHSIVVLFPVGLSSIWHFQQVLLGVEVSSGFFPVGFSSVEETSTPKKTYWKCFDSDDRPTGKNKYIEWDDGEKGNSNLIVFNSYRCTNHDILKYCELWVCDFSFKYHVSCTDGKISVRINLLFYLFFHRRTIQQLCVSFLKAIRR